MIEFQKRPGIELTIFKHLDWQIRKSPLSSRAQRKSWSCPFPVQSRVYLLVISTSDSSTLEALPMKPDSRSESKVIHRGKIQMQFDTELPRSSMTSRRKNGEHSAKWVWSWTRSSLLQANRPCQRAVAVLQTCIYWLLLRLHQQLSEMIPRDLGCFVVAVDESRWYAGRRDVTADPLFLLFFAAVDGFSLFSSPEE